MILGRNFVHTLSNRHTGNGNSPPYPSPPLPERTPDKFFSKHFCKIPHEIARGLGIRHAAESVALDPRQHPPCGHGQVSRGGWVWRVAGDGLSIEYCVQLLGLWELREAVPVVDILVPGPRYALRLLSFRLVFGTTVIRSRVQSAVAPTCTPATRKQLWSGITSLAQLKEKERLAEPFSPFCLLSQRVQLQGIGTMDKLFFYDKDMQKLPSHPIMWVCQRMGRETRSGEKLRLSWSAERKFYTPGWICHWGCSLPTAVYKEALTLELCAFIKKAA